MAHGYGEEAGEEGLRWVRRKINGGAAARATADERPLIISPMSTRQSEQRTRRERERIKVLTERHYGRD